MVYRFYARATGWLCLPGMERRLVLLAFLIALPSLALGLEADDYILRERVLSAGPLAAYLFHPLDPAAARAQVLEDREAGSVPWWNGETPRARFFRPLSSLSLWLDFAHDAPAWWMHLENCTLYALIMWLGIALYKELGLSAAGLGWASAFLALDGALAVTVGWISARNTLLATGFGFACILAHMRARATGRTLLLALSYACFTLSLLSGELGLSTLGYLIAHAWLLDRAPLHRRIAVLSPYAALTALYLVNYVTAGHGSHDMGSYRDIFGSPGAALLSFIEAIPVWLATTATVPIAGFQLFIPGARLPVLIISLAMLALLWPAMSAAWRAQPQARMLALGAVLSLAPLAAIVPQDRLRFFIAFGVCGLLGPWIVSDFDAPTRLRRGMARFVWRIHGVWLPLLFVPFMFSIGPLAGDSAAVALDKALPRATEPTAILLNPPVWTVPWYQVAMRAAQGEAGPAALPLYAGGQALELHRVDDRVLEVHAPLSWFATPFDSVGGARLRKGDRIPLAAFTVELLEVDAKGAPLRARFTFDRSLDDPKLAFWLWNRRELTRWTPPPPGSHVQLPRAAVF